MSTTIDNKTSQGSWLAPVLFTTTIFLSASLLFFVQPLFTKIVLPLVGGAPAVWTTAMLFFQTVLIAGYLYAHISTKYLTVVSQVSVHLLFWAAALFFLPLSVNAGWQLQPNAPVALQTLTLFALGVGLPFAVLSANAPLIQSWYSKSNGPSADDPYFLYGASNFGSLVALLAFPILAEPFFGAQQIGLGWTAGFVVLGLCLGLSGMTARHGKATSSASTAIAKPELPEYLLWLLLAFIPSSLMLAITTKISTDLGSFPLIWVLPLSLFLLTFVLTFTNRPPLQGSVMDWLFLLSLGLLGIIASGTQFGLGTVEITVLLLFGFFFIAMKIHRKLYEARPSKENLTIFYVTMSVGGALGGLFNSIFAPVLFVDLDEFRVTLFLCALVLLAGARWPQTRELSKAMLACTIVVLPLLIPSDPGAESDLPILSLLFGALVIGVLFVFRAQAVTCFLVMSVLLIVGKFLTAQDTVFQDRSFFGRHLVADSDVLRTYRNGTTVHGAQLLSDFEGNSRPTPRSYYHPNGPMAQVINSDFGRGATDIGIVGLGVGSLACYARPNQSWQFYEIDAMVDQVARDPALFSFMSRCAGDAPTHIGDARVVLEMQASTRYDILVIDAYSSDAVPVHLMTNEAIALYRARLKENGLLVLHISNRYYDLARPLGRSAADLGLAVRQQLYEGSGNGVGDAASRVVVMARNEEDLAPLDATGKWEPLASDAGRLWTDDYANLLSVLR